MCVCVCQTMTHHQQQQAREVLKTELLQERSAKLVHPPYCKLLSSDSEKIKPSGLCLCVCVCVYEREFLSLVYLFLPSPTLLSYDATEF